MNPSKQTVAAQWFLRVALATSFFTSLGDRFGVFGKRGGTVTWGDWAAFQYSAGKLAFWLPSAVRPSAAWVSTALELLLALLLLTPFRTRWVAGATGLLLTTYAVSITFAWGFLPSSSYSVWTAAGAAFLLAATVSPAGTRTS